ncbi:hypothetical protein [Henriciella mobilis]|uniref:hypothetical protein n=1 Tax=Henriciella mobilis TaxID=2305467 RepID=UPI0011C37018|nr:hypothetical protein [Henriciella mobilis]
MAARSKTQYWLVAVVCFQTVAILFLAFSSFELRLKPISMTYADWIAILLTAVAVIVTVLALFLGILAFVGWQTFDKRIRQRVVEYIKTGFSRDGDLREELAEAVERASYDIAANGKQQNDNENGEENDADV